MIAKTGSKSKGLRWATPPSGWVLHSPGGDRMLDAELSSLCLEELIKLRLNIKEAGSSALLLQECWEMWSLFLFPSGAGAVQTGSITVA